MWHKIDALLPEKFVKVDEAGRIIGRIQEKDGEWGASKVVVDAEGIGHSVHKGFYFTLNQAKAVVDAV